VSGRGRTPGPAWLLKHLRPVANERRIPLSGTCELTARCNLGCGHCFIVDHAAPRPASGEELDAATWAGILDDLADAGCLWLGLTGGEPLLRPDFPTIYEAARRRGFLVTLLTNGTVITDGIADLLAALPPLVVDISLYGASEATCERVTGDPLAFTSCLEGTRRLLDRGVRVSLKTALTRDNAPDLPALRRIADDLGVPFRTDGVLNAHLDRRTPVTALRLDPRELIAMELSEPAVIDAWAVRAEHMREVAGRARTRLDCGAAVSAFHVDWRGRLCPCLMVREPAIDISQGGFARAWHGPLADLARSPASPDGPCVACELAPVCDQCGGFGGLEHGDIEKPIEYVCAVAQARREALERLRPEVRWMA
jgi:radical SAM protein with 4Fe4S-binding SPASM domain